MKLYHPDKTVTSCSFEGQTVERSEDGSFEAPDHAVELLAHGFTTQQPEAEDPEKDHLTKGATHDEDETGEDVLVKLAATTRANIAAYAKQAYGLELDPIKMKKDDMLLAVAKAAADAADAALAAKAEAEAKAARLAELEAKTPEELTPEELEQLAALQAELNPAAPVAE